MCNLYNLTTAQAAIVEWTRAMSDFSGNLPETFNLWPDWWGPVVRNKRGRRELARVRWGLPSSEQALFEATKVHDPSNISTIIEKLEELLQLAQRDQHDMLAYLIELSLTEARQIAGESLTPSA